MPDDSREWYMSYPTVYNNGFEDQDFLDYAVDGFDELRDSVLGCDVEIYDKKIRYTPRKVRAIMQNEIADGQVNARSRQMLCDIGTLKSGQYVKYKGGWWIVRALPDNCRIYEKGLLWKCTYTLRFRSPLTQQIVEYPIVNINTTQYGTGESRKTHMYVGADKHAVYLPCTDETILIDAGFRFIMDKNRERPTVYRVTRADTVTLGVGSENFYDGLIELVILMSQFNEDTDSKEEMVADYYVHQMHGKVAGKSVDRYRLVLTDLDGDGKLALGEEKCIQVSCIDGCGNPVDEFECSFEYDLAGDAAEVVSEGAGVITLRAPERRDIVGRMVSVKAFCEDYDVETEIKILIVDW